MQRKANKYLLLLILFISLSLVLTTGCSDAGEENNAPAEEESSFPLSVTDDAGREVEIPSPPEKIVSLMPSHTEILFALGMGEQVVGVTDFCNYPEEALAKEKVGDSFNINIEKIISLEPDLVLASTGESSLQAADVLEENGIPTLILCPQNIDQVEETIELLGKITGSETAAVEIIEQMEAEKSAVMEKAEANTDTPKVLVLIDTTSLYTVGAGEFLDELITLAGGENIAAKYGEGYFVINEEAILQEDPDVIISTFPMKEEIMARENWQEITAVREGHIFDVNGDLVSRQGPRITKGLEEVYAAIFPEQ